MKKWLATLGALLVLGAAVTGYRTVQYDPGTGVVVQTNLWRSNLVAGANVAIAYGADGRPTLSATGGGVGGVTNIVNASTNGSGWVGLLGPTNNGDVRIKTLSAAGSVTVTDQGTNVAIGYSGAGISLSDVTNAAPIAFDASVGSAGDFNAAGLVKAGGTNLYQAIVDGTNNAFSYVRTFGYDLGTKATNHMGSILNSATNYAKAATNDTFTYVRTFGYDLGTKATNHMGLILNASTNYANTASATASNTVITTYDAGTGSANPNTMDHATHADTATDALDGSALDTELNAKLDSGTAATLYLSISTFETSSNDLRSTLVLSNAATPLKIYGSGATTVSSNAGVYTVSSTSSGGPAIITNALEVGAGAMSPGYAGPQHGGWVAATAGTYTNGLLLQDQYLFGQGTNSGVQFGFSLPHFAGDLSVTLFWSSTNTFGAATNNTVWQFALTPLSAHDHLTNGLIYSVTNKFSLTSSNSLLKATLPTVTVTNYPPHPYFIAQIGRLGTNTWDKTNLAGATRLVHASIRYTQTNWMGGF